MIPAERRFEDEGVSEPPGAVRPSGLLGGDGPFAAAGRAGGAVGRHDHGRAEARVVDPLLPGRLRGLGLPAGEDVLADLGEARDLGVGVGELVLRGLEGLLVPLGVGLGLGLERLHALERGLGLADLGALLRPGLLGLVDLGVEHGLELVELGVVLLGLGQLAQLAEVAGLVLGGADGRAHLGVGLVGLGDGVVEGALRGGDLDGQRGELPLGPGERALDVRDLLLRVAGDVLGGVGGVAERGADGAEVAVGHDGSLDAGLS